MTSIRDAILSLVDEVRGVKDLEVTVGIEDDPELATRLVATELGVPPGSIDPPRPGNSDPTVPRPALSRAFDEVEADVIPGAERALADGENARAVLRRSGERILARYQSIVQARVVAPLKPSTVAKRRSQGKDDQPLVDSGDTTGAVRVNGPRPVR